MSTMAEVLAAHQLCVAWEDEASQGITCLCGFEIPTEKVRNEIDMDFLAAHQADELTKAGYGKLADAWDAGHESGFWNGRESAGNVEGLLIGVEHARERNPYRSAS